MVEPTQDEAGVWLVWDGGTFGDGRTLVSKEDVPRILPLALWREPDGYIRCSGAHPYAYLHNFIMGHRDPERPIDHINDRRWDNRRSNLRILSRGENTQRPWRLDDAEEARVYQDYQDGRILAADFHAWLRERRDKRKL